MTSEVKGTGMKQTRIWFPGTTGAGSLNAQFGPIFRVWFGVVKGKDADTIFVYNNPEDAEPRLLNKVQKARIRRAFPGVKIRDVKVQ